MREHTLRVEVHDVGLRLLISQKRRTWSESGALMLLQSVYRSFQAFLAARDATQIYPSLYFAASSKPLKASESAYVVFPPTILPPGQLNAGPRPLYMRLKHHLA